MSGLKQFSDFPEISPETLEVLRSLSFERSTPVQEATIPLFCGNKDVAVDASTGSGKTLAFVIPITEKLRRLEEKLKLHQVGAIIVSPTRELAKQIFTVAEPFFDNVPGLKGLLLVGGTDPAQDVAKFKSSGGHILIGTPGRIDDILRRCTTIDLKHLEVLVLDEADRLLDMGFKQQLDSIMARLPKQRRTGLFSATQTEAVEALARAGLRNPVRINVAVSHIAQGKHGSSAAGGGIAAMEEQKTPSQLQIEYLVCEADEKLPQLVAFLQQHVESKVIVYFLTCNSVDFFSAALKRLPQLRGTEVWGLHGKMKQAARESTLEAYSKHPAGVLLCTDLAARGLDIPDVHWIVQYDPPQDPAAFIHRVGRTARMGRAGNAVVYLLPNETTYTEFLRLRKVPLSEGKGAAALPVEVLAALRREAETDREMMEKGTRAFVSYVRGYKEHHCKFIFRVQDLDIGRLATSHGLLRLPKMPDMKRPKGMEHFKPSPVDPASVRFKDKTREKQRKQVMKQRDEKLAAEGPSVGHKRKAAPTTLQPSDAKLPAAKRRQLQQRDEVSELQQEYTLLKKLKRGKISEHQFDVATGLSSDEEGMQAGPAPIDVDGDGSDADEPHKAGKQHQVAGQGIKNSGAKGSSIQGLAAQQSRLQEYISKKQKKKKRKVAAMK